MNEPLVVRNVRSILDEDYDNFKASLVRSSKMNVDTFRSIAINTVMGDTKLYDCEPLSVYRCILQTAQLGLNPAMQHVYFVPYKKTCTLIIGYKGLLHLVWSTALISSMDSCEVYEGDKYVYVKGTSQSISHEPISSWRRTLRAEKSSGKDSYGNMVTRFTAPEAWSHITDFYAWCRLFSGDILVHSMTRQEIEYVRDRFSKSTSSGPWTDHYVEMGKKTVVRRLLALLPKSSGDAEMRLSRAISIDRQADEGADQELAFPQKASIDNKPIATLLHGIHTVPTSVPPGHEPHRGKSINDESVPIDTLHALKRMKQIDLSNSNRDKFREADEEFLKALQDEIRSRSPKMEVQS